MDDIFVYLAPLPIGVNEAIMQCADGFTIYLADRLDQTHRISAYRHAVRHIKRGDWKKVNVQRIEGEAHGED